MKLIENIMDERAPSGSPVPEEEILQGQEDESEMPDEDEEMYEIGDADDINALFPNSDDEDDGSDDAFGPLKMNRVTPERDDSILTFSGHSKSLFCCSFHPNGDLAVTGAEDEVAHVWSTIDGTIVHTITNHNDSVIAAAFSHDGNYLATGDMNGEINVFDINDNYTMIANYSTGADMNWMKWHFATNVLIAGCHKGEVYVWRVPSGDCKVLPEQGCATEIGVLTSDGKSLIVGYHNGIIKIWDIRTCSVTQEINNKSPIAHTSNVTCVSVYDGNFLSGSEDGQILIGSKTGPLGVLLSKAGSIESIAYCPYDDMKIAASGTIDGKIVIWDITRQAVRFEPQYQGGGISNMFWLPDLTLVCSTLDGNVIGFDGRNGQQKFKLCGHEADIFDMVYNKNKNTILTASFDGKAKIFKIN